MASPSPVPTPLEALKRVLTAFRLVMEAQDIDPIDTAVTVSAVGATRRPLARVSLATILEQADAAEAAAEGRA